MERERERERGRYKGRERIGEKERRHGGKYVINIVGDSYVATTEQLHRATSYKLGFDCSTCTCTRRK